MVAGLSPHVLLPLVMLSTLHLHESFMVDYLSRSSEFLVNCGHLYCVVSKAAGVLDNFKYCRVLQSNTHRSPSE